ncbi:MAG: nickel pincer cofactor biosynthesis protein LarC [bacterium]
MSDQELPQGLHLHFDCPSGIAGDMTLGALLHLGVDQRVVAEALRAVGLPGLVLRVSRVTRAHLAALHVQGPTEADDEPARTWQTIRALLRESALSPAVRQLAEAIFSRLAHAEAAVHGTEVDAVHFHEVGGLDAIADIVGIAAAIVQLAPSGISATPLPLGGGVVKTRHGELPVPAPATLELLKGVPVSGCSEQGELVTPTGAAVLAELCGSFGGLPPMRLVGQGYGAGTRDPAGRANVVRAVVGEPLEDVSAGEPRWVEASANIDDMNPEWGPYAIERLLAEGAKDAWQEPLVMKKGRAGVKLGFLCLQADIERLAQCLMAESTTIGVRYHPVWRVEAPRTLVTVQTPYGEVRIKVSGRPGGPRNVAPEFEDCLRCARATGVVLKEVYRAALAAHAGNEEGH